MRRRVTNQQDLVVADCPDQCHPKSHISADSYGERQDAYRTRFAEKRRESMKADEW